jgi:hypothetical protein
MSFLLNTKMHRFGIIFLRTCAAFFGLTACAQKDPLIGKWTTQLNENKSFVLENTNSSLKGAWDFGKDAKKLVLTVNPAQSTEKGIPSFTFEAVEASASKSLKMSMAIGQNVVHAFLPAK